MHSWFTTIFTFLDNHNIIYLLGTFLMWSEARASRIRQDEPHIQMYIEPDEKKPQLFKLIVENLGPVPIYNLKIKVNHHGLVTTDGRKLEELTIFNHQIPVLGIQRKLRTVLISFPENHNKASRKINFLAEYQRRDGKFKKQRFDFDIALYEDVRTEKTPA